jgi:predicted TPR repeat methyltransferase
MTYSCPCPENNESEILYQAHHNSHEIKVNVECTSHSNENIKHWKPTLLKCKKCKLIFSSLVNTDFEDSYINVIDETYISQIPFKTKTLKLQFKKIRQHLNKNSEVLEIGSYYGVLGNIIKPHVKIYTGLELSKHAAKYSIERYNLNVIVQSLDKFLKNGYKYDVIIMTDVIEHLDDPFNILKLIEKSLKSNGVLILSTFNIASVIPRIMKRKYYWIIPMHKYYFSNSTLKYFLYKYNLHLFKVKTDTRLISLKYLLNKFIVFAPKLAFAFNYLLNFNFVNNLTVRVNLLDLNIYFSKKK